METVWYVLLVLMLTAYACLDGFDLGAGALHLLIARTDDERRLILRSIGPVWDGNEVWLIAAGGTLYFAFPLLYASSLCGFYLSLHIVLWLLILRAVGIEFRAHLHLHLARLFRWCVFPKQHCTDRVLRCGVRKRDPRRTAAGRPLLL